MGRKTEDWISVDGHVEGRVFFVLICIYLHGYSWIICAFAVLVKKQRQLDG